jgi:hypothetical protein
MNLPFSAKIAPVSFLLMLLAVSGFSQTVEKGNFQFNTTERSVSWVRVFEPEQQLDFESLFQYFKGKGIIGNLTVDSTSFKGEFEKRPIDLRKYGRSRGNTPMVLIDVEQFFDVLVEFKDGRYRATLTDLGYIDNGVISDITTRALVGNVPTSAKGNQVSYNGDFSFNKKNEVRNSYSTIFEILDQFYTDMMTFKSPEPAKSDW